MNENIKVTLTENRKFSPSKNFVKNAVFPPTQYKKLMALGKKNPEKYWADAARELEWFKPFKKTLSWKPPVAKWFIGGKLNASVNCIDRHLKTRPNQAAIVWEGEPGETSTWTYQELFHQVQKLTASLRRKGLKKGDCVAIYMPMVPEAAVAMLACARGGFTHTVIFGGFSSEALKDRIQDANAKVVITADFGYRKGSAIHLWEHVEAALIYCPGVKHAYVLRRAHAGKTEAPLGHIKPSHPVRSTAAAEVHDWHEATQGISAQDQKKEGYPEVVDSEHPLFILYTSGTTGKPKGLVHTTGGYLTGALRSTKLVFDLRPTDLYWSTADIGWVTGHTYVVYGPLALGASVFMYEGAPNFPAQDRFWQMIERHKVTVLYTAPTAIRSFMKSGTELLKARDLSSLRLLGSVGEPINPEAWMWYRENVGAKNCPIVDTYWQTETGSIVISPVPSVTATKPGSATFALPGYDVDVVDKKGKPVPKGQGGLLVIKKPWPSMARTIHGDPKRFKEAYFSEFDGKTYFSGDGARRDKDGYIWCLGRVDDVLNVSGHRLGTMEIESALVSHKKVAEAAVVGRPDDLKGQAVVAFVTLKTEFSKQAQATPAALDEIRNELKAHVAKEIGAIARPDDIRLTEALPKTRSGKIMRRLLRELAAGGTVIKGDTSTLEDLSVLAALQKEDE